jgi:hypothetical protein
MTCLYGGEKKFSGDSTIVIRPYEGIPAFWVPFYAAALVPDQYNFDANEICSNPIQTLSPITVADLGDVFSLNGKVENLSKYQAWFKGCQCKPKPPVPMPPDDPEPFPPPDPETPPTSDAEPTCETSDYSTGNWLIYKRFNPTSNNWEWFREGLLKVPASVYITILYKLDTEVFAPWRPFNELPEDFGFGNLMRLYLLYVEDEDGNAELIDNTQTGLSSPKVLECAGFVDPTPPSDDLPPLPDYCDGIGGGDSDCLKLPDRAFIISELQAWISESNNRIRDEIIDALSVKTSLDKGDIAGYITSAKNDINENIEFTQSVVISRYEALRTVLDEITPELKSWIDGAKNQILLAITAATTATGLAIAAAVTTIGAAITAAVTSITTAITAAQNALTSAVNASKDELKTKIEDEGEKNNPERLVVEINVTSFPTNQPVTSGRNGSPDRSAFGWMMFVSTKSNGTKFYHERQFINFSKSIFVSPIGKTGLSYTVHFFPNVIASVNSFTRREVS